MESSAINLRNWNAADAYDLAIIANHRQIASSLRDNFPFPFSLTHATDFIRRNIKNNERNIQKAIICNGKLVGAIGVELKEDIFKYSGELGYWVTPEFWGKGVATQSVKLMVALAFYHLKMNRMYAEVFGNNMASLKILEKCNFEKEAILKNSIFKDGQFLDCYIFALQNELNFIP